MPDRRTSPRASWFASARVRSAARMSLCCGVLLLCAGFYAAHAQIQSTGQVPSTVAASRDQADAQRGRLIAKTRCAACHGLDGNSPQHDIPKLAGQDQAYLYDQLHAFRSGTRHSKVMAAMAAGLTDREMLDAASYFARQRRRPDALKAPDAAAQGKRIYLGGIPGRVPPCARCHGPIGTRSEAPMMGGMMGGMRMGRSGMGGMGMMGGGPMGAAASVAVPNLAGQHAAYLVTQLDRFAQGTRANPVMDMIAARLDKSKRAAVAAYLSAASPH